jgi:hypothetical protein
MKQILNICDKIFQNEKPEDKSDLNISISRVKDHEDEDGEIIFECFQDEVSN